ncbi:two-component system, OmpR family, response regulator [Aureimonas jatrophae]|uniref:Regulatory protein VirG n=2 Tax=Aureimonas jatrophae TaxID=1166073 RepID=A0A1H0KAE4_9HYPH|nr:two-component system, OmpR family, response regulator [Aureimonas jatrophae]
MILVVEDDPVIASLLAKTLDEAGMTARTAGSGIEMDVQMRRETFDLIVLDLMLPGEDGFQICRRLRAQSTIPILMLTAQHEEIDRIVGLELGADDYVTKPFSTREVMARIRSLLRRASYAPEEGDTSRPLRFDDWTIDPKRRQVRNPSGARVSLTTTEFDLLLALCRNPNRVLSREQLLTMTHAGLAGPVERSIDVHISRLRAKIEPDPAQPTLLTTVRLAGYMFTASVESA